MLRRRTPLKRSGLQRSNKPIRKVGRVGRYRQERKRQWIQDHPPDIEDEDGNLTCWLCWLCNYPVHISVMKLEHKLPKGSTPKAIAEHDDNLGPSHEICNTEKGSKRL